MVDIDLLADILQDGEDILDHKQGFFEIDNTYSLNILSALMKSDGTLDTGIMDKIQGFFDGNLTDLDTLDGFTLEQDATSAQEKDWTVPADKRRIVITLTLNNATRAFNPQLRITKSGGSEYIITSEPFPGTSATTCSTTKHVNLMWGIGILVLAAGDKITTYDAQFQAADVMKSTIGYIEVDA